MAREGEVCGALSGALMVLGLEYGSQRPEGKEEMYHITREFMQQFEQRHGTILCKRLLGHDISTPLHGAAGCTRSEPFRDRLPRDS